MQRMKKGNTRKEQGQHKIRKKEMRQTREGENREWRRKRTEKQDNSYKHEEVTGGTATGKKEKGKGSHDRTRVGKPRAREQEKEYESNKQERRRN